MPVKLPKHPFYPTKVVPRDQTRAVRAGAIPFALCGTIPGARALALVLHIRWHSLWRYRKTNQLGRTWKTPLCGSGQSSYRYADLGKFGATHLATINGPTTTIRAILGSELLLSLLPFVYELMVFATVPATEIQRLQPYDRSLTEVESNEHPSFGLWDVPSLKLQWSGNHWVPQADTFQTSEDMFSLRRLHVVQRC
jgi:hypothetical protein